MATSFYFNNYSSSQEQNLLQDLIAESIKIYGTDMYYLPRSTVQYDGIYTEDTHRQYNQAIFMEMYLKNVDGFEGDGSFLSKFNLEIRDQITLSVSARSFYGEITSATGIERPREGDLIFFPQVGRLLEIMYVDKYSLFVPLGSLPLYDVKCEMFEYNGEIINTGVYEIDSIQTNYSSNLERYSLLDEGGFALLSEEGSNIINEEQSLGATDPTADNEELQTEADLFVDFSERDPFSEGAY